MWSWRENIILQFWQKSQFCSFGGKLNFAVLAIFVGKINFVVLAGKQALVVLAKKHYFAVLGGIHHFVDLVTIRFYGFDKKNEI